MSADNYIFVSKDGDKYTVSHRFASVYYADECVEPPMEGYSLQGSSKGWEIFGDEANAGVIFATLEEATAAATRRPDWMQSPPKPISVHDLLADAILAAHKEASEMDVLEYGVCVKQGLIS